MEDVTRLDRVFIFDGKLSFLIPHDWVETGEGDHYLYHHPETDSGWRRVSLITVKSIDETPAERLKRLFDGTENVTVKEQSGNLVSAYEKDSEEEGVPIHLYYWKVANTVLPDMVCEAVFSYAVLRERLEEPDSKRVASLVGQLVTQALFSSPT